MKILHSADWHIGPFPGPEKEGVNLRELDTYTCIETMIDTAKEELPDFAVISGDIFHTAKVWSNRALQEAHKAREYIEALSELCIVVVLYGTPNHDLREQFIMLEDYFDDNPRVVISTFPQRYVFTNASRNGESIQICTLPGFDRGVYRAKFPGLSREEENQVFTDELNNIVLGLKAQCTPDIPSVLISHYTVPGCNTESGQITFFSGAEPVITPETINTAAFDLVALGHIHRPQEVTGCPATFYSGAINAFNFNDEGQKRGFYIHILPCEANNRVLSSYFYETPYRVFRTIQLTETDIVSINTGEIDAVAAHWWSWGDNAGIKDKIVRVLYTCSDEANKAFNKALLEKRLYENGAFWVSDIIPASVDESIVKEEFVDDNTPVDNLQNYLAAKNYDEHKIAAIVAAARPIIGEAISGSAVSRFTGIFEPLEIEVSNYRNYESESFNFKDITFCTINGANGAGKSSLFMDAILDCLYEEPREDELTGWINNSENAKSGTITFTFKIGEKTFRVTRTRVKKSRNATLNLSELVDGEWRNRSKEKIRDTQDEIINILGMDSLTFKSCALIMQNQYDIFLQSSNKDRMSVLTNLLGLGVYVDMETISKSRLSEVNKQLAQMKNEIDKLSGSVVQKSGIEDSLKLVEDDLCVIQSDINNMTASKDTLHNKLSTKLDAAARALKYQEDIATLDRKKTVVESGIRTQESIMANASLILAQTSEIQSGIMEHSTLLEQEKTLISGKATFEAKQKEQHTTSDLIASYQKTVDGLENEKNGLIAKHKPLETQLAKESELSDASIRYQDEKQRLSELEKCSEKYIELSASIEKGEKAKNELNTTYSTELAQRLATYRGYEEKTKLLKDTGCIDVANAKCKFLADAQSAAAVMGGYQQECTTWKEAQLAEIKKYQTSIDRLTEQRASLGYNPEAIRALKATVAQLESLHMEYERLGAVKEQVRLIDERLAAIDMLIPETQKTLIDTQAEAVQIADELTALKVAADEYDALKLKIMVAAKWLEKEKLLPVAKEQKDTAEKRISELKLELSDLAAEILTKQQELNTEMEAATGSDELQHQYDELIKVIEEKQASLNEANVQIGAIRQQLSDIEKKSKEIDDLQGRMNALANNAAIFGELKIAFSQDGIPHNIIRSIVPLLAAKANNILGQMTGGRMGLEFKTDKVCLAKDVSPLAATILQILTRTI